MKSAIAMLTLAAAFATLPTRGQTTYTWNNNGADWGNAANWTPAGGPPGTNDTAFFD